MPEGQVGDGMDALDKVLGKVCYAADLISGLRKSVKAAVKKAGIHKQVSPHVFRQSLLHTY